MESEPVQARPDLGVLAQPRVGSTAFGFAILQELRRLAKKRGWLSEAESALGLPSQDLGRIVAELEKLTTLALRRMNRHAVYRSLIERMA